VTPDQILIRLTALGYRVRLTVGGPQLVRLVAELEPEPLPPELREELKQNRGELILLVQRCCCRECGRVTLAEEDRQRLIPLSNPFCERAKCPYRQE
jgi:hypothetical protein